MSRSAEPLRVVRRVVIVGLVLGGLSAPAIAEAAPQPNSTDIQATTVDVVARVVDIATSTADLGAEARVDQLPDRVTVTLDATVLFAKDRAAIRPAAGRRLAEVAAELATRGPGRVRIVGYTDDLGSAAHGLDLSRRRARAVAAVLRAKLPASGYAFTILGRGEADPAVPNTSEKNRRINRRVVVTVTRS